MKQQVILYNLTNVALIQLRDSYSVILSKFKSNKFYDNLSNDNLQNLPLFKEI